MKQQIKTCLIAFFAITIATCLTMFASCSDFGKDSIQSGDSSSVTADNSSCGAIEDVYCGETYTQDGDYIYFGRYPQAKVSDSAIISALNSASGSLPTATQFNDWTDYKYYIEADNSTAFMWYKDVVYGGEKYRGVYFTSYRSTWCNGKNASSEQNNNGYSIGTCYWFKYQPIKWRVLTNQNGKAFLLCNIAIDSQEYYHNERNRTINESDVYASNYEYSNIRKWLNDNFYNTAFNLAQQSLIQTTSVDNSARSTNTNEDANEWNKGTNIYACSNTNDKVFLLSEQEVTNKAYGFNKDFAVSDEARQFKSTDYAKAQGCYVSTSDDFNGNCDFWLRSPYFEKGVVKYISEDGNSIYHCSVNCTRLGVLPALWIEL